MATPTLEELGPCIFGRPQFPHGYATKQYKGKQITAHRAAWMEAYGEIPKSMVIDHVCHTVAVSEKMCLGGKCIHRSCYNIKHLELVSHNENMKRGAKSLRNRMYCSGGHKMIDENIGTRKRKNGKSNDFCIPCHNKQSREWKQNRIAKEKGLADA